MKRPTPFITLVTAAVLAALLFPTDAWGAPAATRLADPNAWNDQLEIGPVPGLTTIWHQAPLAAAVPLGAVVQFRMRTPVGAAVTWSGALEVQAALNRSTAEHRFDTLGVHTVSASYFDAQGRQVERSSAFEVIDTASRPVRVSAIEVAAEPIAIDLQDPNASTMDYYFRDESIAALREVATGHYRTSTDRWLTLRAEVEPAAFAPLVEWQVDGAAQRHLGAEVELRPLQPGNYQLSAGPVGSGAPVRLETYAVRVIGPLTSAEVEDGSPASFRAETVPPGFEDEVTWLASTKFGDCDPMLGQGREFTVTFRGTFQGSRQWLGVRADTDRYGQDHKGEPEPGRPVITAEPGKVTVTFGGPQGRVDFEITDATPAACEGARCRAATVAARLHGGPPVALMRLAQVDADITATFEDLGSGQSLLLGGCYPLPLPDPFPDPFPGPDTFPFPRPGPFPTPFPFPPFPLPCPLVCFQQGPPCDPPVGDSFVSFTSAAGFALSNLVSDPNDLASFYGETAPLVAARSEDAVAAAGLFRMLNDGVFDHDDVAAELAVALEQSGLRKPVVLAAPVADVVESWCDTLAAGCALTIVVPPWAPAAPVACGATAGCYLGLALWKTFGPF